MSPNPKLEVEGKLEVIDTTGPWGVYEGEQISSRAWLFVSRRPGHQDQRDV